MKTHYKKLVQPYFDYVRLGIKTFELRKNDCDYQIGDLLVLREYGKDSGEYSGDLLTVRITYILDNCEGLQEGYCILEIEVLEK